MNASMLILFISLLFIFFFLFFFFVFFFLYSTNFTLLYTKHILCLHHKKCKKNQRNREKRCETSRKLNVQCFESNKLHCYCLTVCTHIYTLALAHAHKFLSISQMSRFYLSVIFFFCFSTNWTLQFQFCVIKLSWIASETKNKEKKIGTLHRDESRRKNRFALSSCFFSIRIYAFALKDTSAA